ncbi:SapC family protein [Neptunicella marina]|uniref:SapC family protein n=1 Tax=Neptunicella marina TaxID=2125989 RepID=A0A8J6M019_9ALTE|nr:SapC family protein [Neptunicella marina]MBC3766929.1 SapC family protein [Neptunicella marina]
MSEQIAPLNKEKHAQTKVKQSSTFSHVAGQHLVPVVIHEYVPVSAQLPIIFVRETQDSERFVSCTLMGLTPGENLYVGEGNWDEPYVPLALRNYPFSIAKADEEGKELLVCIDEASELVGDEGEALFDEKGEQTEFLKNRTEQTGRFIENMQITANFVKFLQDKDLLVSNDLSVKLESGQNFNINGIFRIDEEKLAKMTAEEFEEIRKQGVLPAIYAHLNSLQQIQRVARKKMLSLKAAN